MHNIDQTVFQFGKRQKQSEKPAAPTDQTPSVRISLPPELLPDRHQSSAGRANIIRTQAKSPPLPGVIITTTASRSLYVAISYLPLSGAARSPRPISTGRL